MSATLDFDTECPACGHAFSRMVYRPPRRRLAIFGFRLWSAAPARLAHHCEKCGYDWARPTVADGGTPASSYRGGR